VRLRGIFVSVATLGLMVGPAFVHGFVGNVAGARTECTINGTAADDDLNGTTQDDVICGKAGSDAVNGLEGDDTIRGGQGDDGTGEVPCAATIGRGFGCFGSIQRGARVTHPIAFFGLNGNDGSDTIKGQADDDSIAGDDQNDRLVGGPGDDCLGANCGLGGSSEAGNDTLKSRDKVSGNDFVDGGDNTDTCVIDAQDEIHNCEL
jgi:Ca2+-binding RTX toxin-like protein